MNIYVEATGSTEAREKLFAPKPAHATALDGKAASVPASRFSAAAALITGESGTGKEFFAHADLRATVLPSRKWGAGSSTCCEVRLGRDQMVTVITAKSKTPKYKEAIHAYS